MKVYISNYRNHWISPYKILEYMFFWTDWSKCGRWTLTQTLEDEQREKSQWVDHPAWVETWSDRLEPVSRAIQWILDRVHPRVEYVKIDRWDTWSMDATLASIVLPMLRQLKKDKHGAPFVDDEDVPEHLRSTAAPPRENEWDTDDNHFLRWDWVIDEMIYAFEKKNEDDWASEFHSGDIDWISVPVDKDGNEVPRGEHRYFEMKDGPNHTHKIDMEGMEAVQKRISNGFRLFGKYYEALWD
jgi:hypothetical protein